MNNKQSIMIGKSHQLKEHPYKFIHHPQLGLIAIAKKNNETFKTKEK